MLKKIPLPVIIFGLIGLAYLILFICTLQQPDAYWISGEGKIVGRQHQTHYDLLLQSAIGFCFALFYYQLRGKAFGFMKISPLIHCTLAIPFTLVSISIGVNYQGSIRPLASITYFIGASALYIFLASLVLGLINLIVGSYFLISSYINKKWH
jgi:hypothetical protein